MAKVKVSSVSNPKPKRRKAISPEAREQQLISLAIDRAEQQLLDGTASSQVITHFLKLGTEKYKLELEKSRQDTELSRAKTEAIEDGKHRDELYEKAIKAMQVYNGRGEEDDYY